MVQVKGTFIKKGVKTWFKPKDLQAFKCLCCRDNKDVAECEHSI